MTLMRPQAETRRLYKVVLLSTKCYWSFRTTLSSHTLDPIYKCLVDHAQAFFGAGGTEVVLLPGATLEPVSESLAVNMQ